MAIPRIGPRTDEPDVVGDVNAVFDVIEAQLDALAASPTRIVGEVLMWPVPTAPANWLILDGRTVSRTTYASLYAVLSDTYGAGDGSTTFNLPDGTDVVIMGASGGAGVGGRGGALSVVLSDANLPPHAHSMNHDHPSVNSGSNSVSHTHSINHSHTINTRSDELGTNPNRVANAGGASHAIDGNSAPNAHSGSSGGQSANHYHSVNIPSYSGNTGNGNGSSVPVDITPANLRMHFIIYAGA